MHGYQNIMDQHVIKTIWTQEEKQWLNALSVNPDMSFLVTCILSVFVLIPTKLWLIVKEDP